MTRPRSSMSRRSKRRNAYGVGEWIVAQMVMPVCTKFFTTVMTCKPKLCEIKFARVCNFADGDSAGYQVVDLRHDYNFKDLWDRNATFCNLADGDARVHQVHHHHHDLQVNQNC